ncbi:hypothetical protein BU25DRAFT_230408 [Macroventuria anomochaeta]|uniref:Uncharacterized protein n=1 Tax=Macroventuria anomochaeta TaxID=301207 RepID=A0ACB6RL94_9PLEO|nr:uncharacterized protein BU25DRAFT_230408 [Macroventuria anomochaeta]KAF2621742.1 hypothetical protein BU25DRAFT_230408 [Macroventuria anomochaeta]
MPTAITSLDSLGHFMGGSNDHDDQMALSKSYGSGKPSSFSWTNIGPLARSSIGYTIDQIKLTSKTMVETSSTLWCHTVLFDERMPWPLQDAHAACALYNARNDINAEFVVKHITSQVDELIITPPPIALIDLIARAHILWCYAWNATIDSGFDELTTALVRPTTAI